MNKIGKVTSGLLLKVSIATELNASWNDYFKPRKILKNINDVKNELCKKKG